MTTEVPSNTSFKLANGISLSSVTKANQTSAPDTQDNGSPFKDQKEQKDEPKAASNLFGASNTQSVFSQKKFTITSSGTFAGEKITAGQTQNSSSNQEQAPSVMFKVATGGTFAGEKLASKEPEPVEKPSLFGETKPKTEGLFSNSQTPALGNTSFG